MADYVLECVDRSDTASVDKWAAQLAGLTNQFRDHLLQLAPDREMRIYDEEGIREYAQASYSFVTARVDDHLIGSTWLVSAGEGDDQYAFIMMVFVEPDWRGFGVGRAMMEHAMSILRERGCKSVELEVADYNSAMTGFYERLGYLPDRVVHRKTLVA
jgi:GNAT superfamily N-acetyltransferase